MIRAIFITCAICLTSVCFAGSGAEVHMQKMLDKYESLSSYEDSGSSITKFTHIEGNSFSEELRFKTIYEENETLYFEWLGYLGQASFEGRKWALQLPFVSVGIKLWPPSTNPGGLIDYHLQIERPRCGFPEQGTRRLLPIRVD